MRAQLVVGRKNFITVSSEDGWRNRCLVEVAARTCARSMEGNKDGGEQEGKAEGDGIGGDCVHRFVRWRRCDHKRSSSQGVGGRGGEQAKTGQALREPEGKLHALRNKQAQTLDEEYFALSYRALLQPWGSLAWCVFK